MLSGGKSERGENQPIVVAGIKASEFGLEGRYAGLTEYDEDENEEMSMKDP